MPVALPLYHPSAEELHAAHVVYEEQEGRAYAYRLAWQILVGPPPVPGLTQIEAVDLLVRVWNPGSSYTRELSLHVIGELLAATAVAREAFVNRDITSLTEAERATVGDLYDSFRVTFAPVGAAKALGVLHPRFFPLWDTRIAKAYVGQNFRKDPRYYLTFVDYCIEQCTAVGETDFGDSLLKVLDEWNFCIWTTGWIADPRGG